MISIIVPTHNRPEMLPQALQSVLNQTYQDFEIVVVNDGGIDVEHIVSPLNTEHKITYVKHAINRGTSAATNTGFKLAQGHYLAILADDDLFYPEHLETALQYLDKEHPVVYTDAVRATYFKEGNNYRLVKMNVPYSIDYDRHKLLVANISPANCFVFKKDLAFEAGLFDETLRTLEDWEFWIRLSTLSPFKHIPRKTVQVNWRSDGTTLTSSESASFQKNRQIIYERYKQEIDQISNIPEILQEFNVIWKKDWEAETPLTSIIILTHNQLHHTRLCLASIEAHTPQPHELILVDNGSTDGTLDFLRDYQATHQNVRLIANVENLGFAAGNNQGLAIATGDYLLLLNNDTIVTEGWLARMLSVFERYPEVGLVGPMSNHVAGPQLAPEAAYQTLEAMQQFAATWADRHGGQTAEFFRLVGFCLLARRAVIARIGGLDERFGKGNFEDDDFCLRAALAGFKARMAQDVFIHHTGGQTFKDIGLDYGQSLEQNWAIFKAKWHLPAHLPYGTNYLPHLMAAPSTASGLFIPLPAMNFSPTEGERLGVEVKSAPSAANSSRVLSAGAAAVQHGDFETAIREFEAVTRQYPNLAAAYTALGLVLMTLNRLDKAVPVLARAAELVPNLAAAHNQLGVALYRLGRLPEAEVAFQTARQVASDDMESRLNLIDLYREQQRLAEESALVKEALTLDPHHPEVLLSFGVLSLALGDEEGADLAWQRLQAEHPDHPGVAALAEALGYNASEPVNPLRLLPQVETAQTQGDWSQAIELLQDMLQAGPPLNGEAAPLWNRLGYCHFMSQQLAEAETAFQRGLELAPDNLELLGNLADLYLNQEDFDQATHYLNLALQLDPNDVNTLLTLGNCSIQLGVFDTALLAFRRVETLFPETEGIQDVLAQLEGLSNKFFS
ncbi:MAG: glycosyltransferase [Anaerolineae bacterium]